MVKNKNFFYILLVDDIFSLAKTRGSEIKRFTPKNELKYWTGPK